MSNTSTTGAARKNTRPTKSDFLSLASGLRCRPGDLAVIVSGNSLDGIGAIIEVISPYSIDEEGFLWHARTKGRPLNCVDIRTHIPLPPTTEFVIYDCCLR